MEALQIESMKRTWFFLSVGVLFILVSVVSIVIFTRSTSSVTTPDFSTYHDIKEKKQVFFDYLRPLAEEANNKTLIQRNKLLFLQKKEQLSKRERRWLEHLSQQYNVNFSANKIDFESLLERVDIIPISLILAQAANESAWGTSKFARQANNYFGQWCFTLHCGIVPSRRESNQIHEVRKFESTFASVNAYLLNINRNARYSLLRQMRAELRNKNKPLSGSLLAMGLVSYSERGHEYIKDIQAMIRINQLEEDLLG